MLPAVTDERIIVGADTADDAAAFRLDDNTVEPTKDGRTMDEFAVVKYLRTNIRALYSAQADRDINTLIPRARAKVGDLYDEAKPGEKVLVSPVDILNALLVELGRR